MNESLRAAAERWLAEDPDPDTRDELRRLLDADDEPAVAERFAGRLTFGTAGLRGPMRAGPVGMNRAVVRSAAAGLASYLRSADPRSPGRADGRASVVIGYDARHHSEEFARESAAVFAGAGFDALLLPRALPTPVLAYAIRALRAVAGVMVTASHNPPADNGYKVFLGDGAQIVPPADREIEAAIAAVGPLSTVPLADSYQVLGSSLLESYVDAVAGLPRSRHRRLRIVHTALHGVAGPVLTTVLERAGFSPPLPVPEQSEPDPDFPTVAYPNPEEAGAMDLALALAAESGADLVLANDPDGDRCAVGIPVPAGVPGGSAGAGWRMLTGDEVGVLLADHLIRTGTRGTFAATIVSSSLLGVLCAARGLAYAETLTGFKWIVRAADGGGPPLVYGYEEALGYAAAPELVRDKDGMSAGLLVADLAAALRAEGRTLADRLDELAAEFGVYATAQLSVRVDDLALIDALMARMRSEPPQRLLNRPVAVVDDLLPDADVLRLRADRVRVVFRPSGTEPKLKAYLEVVVPAERSVPAARAEAAEQLARLRDELADLLPPSRRS